jgi:hypothetical protein
MAISSAATTAEFELMLADIGVPVVLGDVSTFGLLDYDDQVVQAESGFASGLGAGTQKRGEVMGRQIIVTVLTDDFEDGALAIDTTIKVDGKDYVIRLPLEHSHMQLNLTNLYLSKVPNA